MIALLTIGGGNLFAKTLNADLSKLDNGPVSTWDGSTNTITWTQQSNNMISNFDFPAGNYTSYEKIVVSVSDLSNAIGVRVQIKANGQEKTVALNGTGTFEKSLTTDFGFASEDLLSLEWIRLLGSGYYDGESHTINAENPASAKINSVYLEGPDINYIEATKVYNAPAGTTDLNGMTGSGDIKWTISYPQVVQNETLWGGNIDGDDKSVNIAGYDYLHFVVSTASADAKTGLRVFVCDGTNRVCLYPHSIEDYASVTNWEETTWITAPGTYVVKISDYPLLRGFKALQGWAGNAGSISIASAYVSKDDVYLPNGKYSLVGEATGSVTLDAALADETATLYDATGLTNTSAIELTPANPNAIFIANDGALTNTENVMVGTTIANLVVTDGYPMAVPTGASATAASYTRTMANTYGTVCLPFAVTSDDNYKYYTLGALTADELTLEEAATLPAGTPGVVEKLNDGAMTGSGALANVQAASGTLQLIGTFKPETILASDYSSNIYAISNNQFVQATNSINLPAFRAFFTTTSSESAIRFGFEDEGVTGVNALTGESGVNIIGIYSLDGAAQPSLQKGVNIVKFSDGGVKKIMVK